jgi:hypothetical protein
LFFPDADSRRKCRDSGGFQGVLYNQQGTRMACPNTMQESVPFSVMAADG